MRRLGAGQIDERRKLCQVAQIIDGDRIRVAWYGQEYECRALPSSSDYTVAEVVVCHVLPDNSELVAIKPSLGIECIIIWSGSIATIPAGFKLCDGSEGTPDLRDKFVLGAWPVSQSGDYGAHDPGEDGGWGYEIGLEGGDDTQYDRHRHYSGTQYTDYEYDHQHTWYGSTWTDGASNYDTGTNRNAKPGHSHNLPLTGPQGTQLLGHRHSFGGEYTDYALADTDNRPPYYAAAYIMGKVNVPLNGIVLWGGTLADLPAGFHLCDGYEGTPDLRERFVVGAGDSYTLGDTGGHWRDPAHSHTFSVDNADHVHEFTQTELDPPSGSILTPCAGWGTPWYVQASYPSHTHRATIYSSVGTGIHTHAHTRELSRNGDYNAPQYYTLAYIQRQS